MAYYGQPELILKGSPSMKVPPKRKGNIVCILVVAHRKDVPQ